MTANQWALPRLRRRATFALVAFVATTLVALLAPMVHRDGFEQVCSAQGVRLVATGGASDHGSSQVDPGMHCPLCMPAGAPPAEQAFDFTPVQVHSQPRIDVRGGRIASLVGAPLPARGPPSVS